MFRATFEMEGINNPGLVYKVRLESSGWVLKASRGPPSLKGGSTDVPITGA